MVQEENGRWAKICTYEKMLVGEVEGRTIWVRMVDREGVMVEGRCQVGYRLEVRVGLWSGEMIILLKRRGGQGTRRVRA